MKNLICVLLFLIIASCKKTDKVVPTPTNLGANKIFFKLNGKDRQVEGKLKSPVFNYGIGTNATMNKDSLLVVRALQDQENWSWDFKILKPSIGAFIISDTIGIEMSYISNLKELSMQPNAHFKITRSSTGKVEITTVTNKIISGKFSGILYAPNKDSVKIEDGYFDVQLQ